MNFPLLYHIMLYPDRAFFNWRMVSYSLFIIVCSNWEVTSTHGHNSRILSRINMLEASFAFTHQGVRNYMYHYHLAITHQCKLEKYIVKNRNSSYHNNFNATYTEVLQVKTLTVIGEGGLCTSTPIRQLRYLPMMQHFRIWFPVTSQVRIDYIAALFYCCKYFHWYI